MWVSRKGQTRRHDAHDGFAARRARILNLYFHDRSAVPQPRERTRHGKTRHNEHDGFAARRARTFRLCLLPLPVEFEDARHAVVSTVVVYPGVLPDVVPVVSIFSRDSYSDFRPTWPGVMPHVVAVVSAFVSGVTASTRRARRVYFVSFVPLGFRSAAVSSRLWTALKAHVVAVAHRMGHLAPVISL